MAGLYRVIKKDSEKVIYIGQTGRKNIEKRIKEHFQQYTKKDSRAYNSYFYRTLRKYGLNAFEFEPFIQCDKEELDEKERYWIAYYDTFYNGCNSTKRGKGAPPYNTEGLTDQIVLDIYKDLKDSDLQISDLSLKYGFSLPVISDINRGKLLPQENFIFPIRKIKKDGSICPICGAKMYEDAKLCFKCYSKKRERIDWPTLDEIKKRLTELNGNFTAYSKELGISVNAIIKRLKNNNCSYHSKDYRQPKENKPKDLSSQPKPVAQFDGITQKFLQAFPSTRQAEIFLNTGSTHMHQAIINKKKIRRYYWNYLTYEQYNKYIQNPKEFDIKYN